MTFDIKQWVRMDGAGLPVYINPGKPSWFVPNKAGDRVLKTLVEGGELSFSGERFLDRLPDSPCAPFGGRAEVLSTGHIRELWFHITNACNLSCRHCLFASGPGDTASLDADFILQTAAEAWDSGCRVFALTGGEPFVHDQIETIIKGLLAFADTHVVVLTNGKNLRSHLSGTGYDLDRLHLQISVDGHGEQHDRLRGKGAFDGLVREFAWLKSEGIPFTISMCPTRENLEDMPGMVSFAAESGATNLHYMWYFIRGRGVQENFALPGRLFDRLAEAAHRADACGIGIDNIDTLKTQVFAPPGTIHDGSTTGWESLAVGPDGYLYPSPALIGVEALKTSLSQGLVFAWKNSPVLDAIRNTSVCSDTSPMKYILGGGDSDHSYAHGETFSGNDPYLSLYEKTALWMIGREAEKRMAPDSDRPGLLLKMGDILESCGAHGSVALTHPNCLLAMADKNSITVVKEFYSEAAESDKEEILNPVCYEDDLITHIPKAARFRGYGCGSPVLDADIKERDHVVDLGSGRGIECFIAARITGKTGRVTGVDMLDPMLEIARETAKDVETNLGYSNVEFRKGFLEKLPLEDQSADVVISNCVMNLSVNKRDSFAEIFRVLKKGGRLVISDVVCDEDPGAAIKNDETLRGECIAGAMTQKDLAGILEESGFRNMRIVKRFPYREVRGHRFYSLTYEATRPETVPFVRVMYRGPFRSVETAEGTVLPVGLIREIPEDEAGRLSEYLYIIDDNGAVTNHAYENTCCSCAAPPDENSALLSSMIPMGGVSQPVPFPVMAGCMSCGAPLVYFSEEVEKECLFCGKSLPANAMCERGHFICDGCHSKDAVQVIRNILLNSTETDMLALLSEIRKHPAIPLHGPEHHALVPAVIVAAYRNSGGAAGIEQIETALNRGSRVSGGNCGFNGVCGAAEGVGIGFSIILDANPLKPDERQAVQKASAKALLKISDLNAPRCCQRESWIALKQAAEASVGLLSTTLKAEHPLICAQKIKNIECIGDKCPLA